MAQVHHFKVWNATNDKWEVPPSKRAAESIVELKGEIVPDTAEEIDPALIDGQGRYFPSGAGVRAESLSIWAL